EREQNAVIEMVDMQVWFQHAFAPPMTAEQKHAAKARASSAIEGFRARIAERLNSGRKLLGEALADAVFDEDDFLQIEQQPVAAE
ncbi:MAG: hypothetical protein AAFP24_07505, partial [Pseudomonadota bacterium]